MRLAEAPGVGQTIFEYDPKSSGAKSYRLLAAEMLMRAQEPEPSEPALNARLSTEQRLRFSKYRHSGEVH